MPLGSGLSSRLAVRHSEKGVLFISFLVCSISPTHMLAFLAETLSQIMFPRQIPWILQNGTSRFRFLLLPWMPLEKLQSKW